LSASDGAGVTNPGACRGRSFDPCTLFERHHSCLDGRGEHPKPCAPHSQRSSRARFGVEPRTVRVDIFYIHCSRCRLFSHQRFSDPIFSSVLPPLSDFLYCHCIAASVPSTFERALQRLGRAAFPGQLQLSPPIMAGMTPSPDVSPVSAATTNGHFPRDSFCLNLSTLPDASNFVLKSTLKSPHLLESPNGFYTGSFKKRPRNMSQSSGTDPEMSNDGTQAASNGTAPTSNGEPRSSTKKRPSTDTIDYPRRRATIAVLQPPFLAKLCVCGADW
jgi:hypothetical protein